MLTVLYAAEKRNTLTPVVPLRQTAEAAGLGVKATRNGLRRLTEKKWLMVVSRGKPGRYEEGKGVAAIYRVRMPRALEPEN